MLDDCDLDCKNGGRCVLTKDAENVVAEVMNVWSKRCLCLDAFGGDFCERTLVSPQEEGVSFQKDGESRVLSQGKEDDDDDGSWSTAHEESGHQSRGGE